ncbi:Protein sds23 [Penicillium chermesinum]|uniref:Protein sds23 n=1 Tax=Penicillium chermesinum TaxID=63820 RepID=A0A9W9TRB9_9EURO|nr:Protein sds23 [Penicillium chermesinum]KAJ5238297.1 Protein sds23 [Penicillium chermesinum]
MADKQSREGSDASLTFPENDAGTASPRSSTDSRSSNRTSLRITGLPTHQHRQSLSESLRGPLASPRARRQPSLTQSAVQSLIDNPPPPKNADPAFMGRDWRHIAISELVSPDDLHWVEMDTGIEEATNVMIDSGISVLLIRETPQDNAAIATFDYSDLNTYLLLAAGLILPGEGQRASYDELARKARDGEKISIRDVKNMGLEKEPLTTLPATANVLAAVETFGGGVHRVVVTKEDRHEVVGIFSQFRLVKFLWENGRSFPVLEELYPQSLRDLSIGSQNVISINFLPDHLPLPLLQNTCTHFISVILSTRGLIEGKDSFPVFHVNPTSTLAHTVAKIVATKSHRLWVTDPMSPSSSGPPTPSQSSTHVPLGTTPLNVAATPTLSPPASPHPLSAPQTPLALPHLPTPPQPAVLAHSAGSGVVPPMSPSIPASALPGARLSGRLVGVVSLTDILNLHARASGLSPADPAESRRRRRSSSSSSLSVRRSGEVGRELFSRGL